VGSEDLAERAGSEDRPDDVRRVAVDAARLDQLVRHQLTLVLPDSEIGGLFQVSQLILDSSTA